VKSTSDRFHPNRATRSTVFLCLLATLSLSPQLLVAQNNPQAAAADTDTPPPSSRPAQDSPAVDVDTAWSMLTSALLDTKHTALQTQALAALGTIGSSSRAAKMITDSMHAPDLDVRTAAVLAAGQSPAQTAKRNFSMELRTLLDDKEPQVAVAAASTLWKMGDHSGEDILVAVAAGERKASAGLMDSTRHTITTDLHNPSTIARIGALQGASMLLGPFGFGITAYEYIHKNGADTSRTLAIELISQSKTKPIHDELINALTDKDVGVRAAAAKALGEYHDKETAAAIANLFYDSKPPVRLTAAAAYLRASGAVIIPSATTRTPSKKSQAK
jgi:HEAT repeat protein